MSDRCKKFFETRRDGPAAFQIAEITQIPFHLRHQMACTGSECVLIPFNGKSRTHVRSKNSGVSSDKPESGESFAVFNF